MALGLSGRAVDRLMNLGRARVLGVWRTEQTDRN